MKKLSVYIFTWLLLLPGMLMAKEFSGFIDLGQSVRNDSAQGASPYLKFRDADSTVVGNMGLESYEKNRYMSALFTDIGQATGSYGIAGGQFEKYSYSLGLRGIVNNATFGAFTMWDIPSGNFGQGTGVGARSDANLFYHMDPLKKESKDHYLKMNYQLNESTYLKLTSNKITTKGLDVYSGYIGGDAPFPLDYETTNVGIEGGYKSESFFASLQASLSKFVENLKEVPYSLKEKAAGTSQIFASQAPDNDTLFLELNSALYDLPLHTMVVFNASLMTQTNTLDPFTAAGTGTGTVSSTVGYVQDRSGNALSEWKGDISYTVAKVIVKSEPITDLTTKLSVEYLDKKNESTLFTSSSISHSAGTVQTSEAFGYEKEKAGIDVSYVLPFDTQISAGYGMYNIKRPERLDATETKDKILSAALRNNALEFISGGVSYMKTDRTSVKSDGDQGASSGADIAKYMKRYVRRWDATDKTETRLGANVELNPLEGLAIGAEYTMVENEYEQIILGRLTDERKIISGYVDYKFGFGLAVSGFYELEDMKSLTKARYVDRYQSVSKPGGNPDPTSAPSNTTNIKSYNWDGSYSDEVTTMGVDVAMPFMEEKLKVTLGYEKQEGDGDLMFAIEAGGDPAEGGPVPNYGDYVLTKMKGKVDYSFSDSFSAAVKYTYERSKINDYQRDVDYGYWDSNYNGKIYGDQDYNAHEVFASVGYKF
ncbi:MAG: hypothetical protein A2X86_21260 [Bdellovibrionales bacterium GWA2_49_15]|nr:MAG: hypothetical protein A2X86_21260 [Bdellovibrionales bacterium GWA2_49_15]